MESFLPSFDVSADGQRFLVVAAALQKQTSPITVVVNRDIDSKMHRAGSICHCLNKS